MAIANNWGVGKKGKNNGILIGISTGLRTIRIQNGYGIEAKLTDAETNKIIEDIILPKFKNGNFFEGTKSGLLALMQKVRWQAAFNLQFGNMEADGNRVSIFCFSTSFCSF